MGLVQINNSFSGANYFPYSAGLLQAYVMKHAKDPSRYEFLLPIFSRVTVEKAVESLIDADVVGFSTYVWNVRLSLAIAKQLKALRPEALIVFGGPQVPDRAEEFLRSYPFIDLACHGEGEQVFLDILERFPAASWFGTPSVSLLDPKGRFVTHPKQKRLKDMSVIPSPYLEGVFDPLMVAYPEMQWLVMWETNRGCPFSCTFCDWGSAIAAKVNRFDLERLYREIDWFSKTRIEFIFCCDANYGILQRDYDITQYVARVKEEAGYPKALSVQNTKNATERAYKVQKLLNDAGLNKGVTISLQSADPTTLTAIKRQNISTDSFQELQRRFTKDRVVTYSDLIIGLPGETYQSFVKSVSLIIENGQHNRIQFGNLSILPNAEMGDPEYQKKYGMVMIESNIINIHGSLTENENDIPEKQDLVIATESMPKPDWIRTRAYAWMTAFLHFDKVFQIPMVLLYEITGEKYGDLIEAFMSDRVKKYPILDEIRNFFVEKALDIQNGGEEYCHSKEWLNIWWPADEFMMIDLVKRGKLETFYESAIELINEYLNSKGKHISKEIFEAAVELNKNLLKIPFQSKDISITLSHSIWEFYHSVLIGERISLERGQFTYQIDRTSAQWHSWNDWYREVVWYGNKKGAYLYAPTLTAKLVSPKPTEILLDEPQFSGHY